MITVGGGPAGPAAALALGRSRRRTLVLDAGEGRNTPAPAVHNFLTRDYGLPHPFPEAAAAAAPAG